MGDVYLGKIISFNDAVTLDDIARAFDQAIRDTIADKLKRRASGLPALPLHRRAGRSQVDGSMPIARGWIAVR